MQLAIESASVPPQVRSETGENSANERMVSDIKNRIQNRFKRVHDEQTGNLVSKPYDEINLSSHCGEVSRFSQQVVGGEIRQKITTGNRPSIFYLDSTGKKVEIASGYARAVHSYVVDEKGKVWDPITNNWGLIEEKEYLDNMM